MKRIFLIISLILVVSCCVPIEKNPDDNIEYTPVEQPRMVTITCYYPDGSTKVITCKLHDVDLDARYVKINQGDKCFVYVGEYSAIYDN